MPFTTSNASKAQIIEGLALAFEQWAISILPDAVLLAELAAFQAEQLPSDLLRYSAPAGQNDDSVIALSFAWSACGDQGVFGFVELLKAGQRMLDEGKIRSRNPPRRWTKYPCCPWATMRRAPAATGGKPQRLPTGERRCAGCGRQ